PAQHQVVEGDLGLALPVAGESVDDAAQAREFAGDFRVDAVDVARGGGHGAEVGGEKPAGHVIPPRCSVTWILRSRAVFGDVDSSVTWLARAPLAPAAAAPPLSGPSRIGRGRGRFG